MVFRDLKNLISSLSLALILYSIWTCTSNPSIIDNNRKNRIANGSGRGTEEVNELLKKFNQMSKMMKMMQGGGAKQMMQMMKCKWGLSGI